MQLPKRYTGDCVDGAQRAWQNLAAGDDFVVVMEAWIGIPGSFELAEMVFP